MIYRLLRLRFVLIRAAVILLLIVLYLQFSTLHNDYEDNKTTAKKIHSKSLKPNMLFDRNKDLTDEQRLEKLEFIEQQAFNNDFNWTKVFLDAYQRKKSTIEKRDSQTIHKYKLASDDKSIVQSQFKIFEETPVFQRPKFCSSQRVFHPQCPYSNCQWTCEKPSMNNEGLRRASIFHHTDINADDMSVKLKHRSSKDIWILWIDEANRQIEDFNQYKFNWTLSFRQDSEVSIGTYGILINKVRRTSSTHNPDLVKLLTANNIEPNDMELENRIFLNYRYRQKYALWFVSNCEPKRRLDYYNRLKGHYPIQAFGLCVENQCNKDNCQHKQSRLALFYLAFESQTCKDYVTEKFWRALYYGMIPIVLGPSKQSYLDLGIPDSAFIHVDDYRSPRDLANYLHKIANDYLIYRNYFQWLSDYQVFYNIKDLEPIRMCELCMRLNMQEYQQHGFYTNVHEWHRMGC